MNREVSDQLLAGAGAGSVSTRAARAGGIGAHAGRISTRAGSTSIFLYRGRIAATGFTTFTRGGTATASGKSESTHHNHAGK